MNRSELKYDSQGIVRNHNGLPAYCFFIEEYCLKPYCLTCSSYEEPKYEPRPKYDADADLFNYLLENPEMLEIVGSSTKKWFRGYKEKKEAELRACAGVR